MKSSTIAVVSYAAAIVSANLLVARYGPSITIVNAFALIGLDLVLRDFLHDSWKVNRARNMLALIVGAGAISYALNPSAGSIAAASSVAFMLAATIDWIVYNAARRWTWFARSNASNLAGAAVDSIVFPALAFGLPLMIPIVVGQFAAKAAGGVVWSTIIGVARNATSNDNGARNDATVGA